MDISIVGGVYHWDLLYIYILTIMGLKILKLNNSMMGHGDLDADINRKLSGDFSNRDPCLYFFLVYFPGGLGHTWIAIVIQKVK